MTDTNLPPLSLWYAQNPDDVAEFEKQMRRKVHYVIKPDYLWTSIANLARKQNGELLNTLQAGFKYIENDSFQSTFQGLFSEIDLASPKLGKTYADRNAKLRTIIQKIAEGLADFSTDSDALGDAYEYLIGQFAAGSGKKAGEFYTPQQLSDILSAIVTLDSQEPKTGKKPKLDKVLDFACGSGSLLLNVRKKMGPNGIGKIFGQEKNITTYNLARMNMLLHGVKDTEFEIFHGYNLNISRYISTAIAEEEIDLAATHRALSKIEEAIQKATHNHNEFLNELRLPLLPAGDFTPSER